MVASFINGQRMSCQAPYRPPGTTINVHLSTGGRHNFSSTSAQVVYYDGTLSVGTTQVSSILPRYGPIHGRTILVARGTNFAPTGWSADAIGTSPLLSCVLNPLPSYTLPDQPVAWSEQWLQPTATFLDYSTVLCNISSGSLWKMGTQEPGVGDATLAVSLQANFPSSRYQVGPSFTFYDPETPPTVVDEQRSGYQPGFLDTAYGVVGMASNVTVTGVNFAPTPALACEFHTSSLDATLGALPLFSTRASFLSATRVLCELPQQGKMAQMLSVHVVLNERPRGVGVGQILPGPSAALLVFYDPAFPAQVTAAVGEATDNLPWPYLTTTASSVFRVSGANFAPTGPASLMCLYVPASVEVARLQREAQLEAVQHAARNSLPPPSDLHKLRAPADGIERGAEPIGSVAVVATYVSANLVHCPLTPAQAPAPGDVHIRIAHTEGLMWSNDSVLVALYDAASPALISSVVNEKHPTAYADLALASTLNVSGSNFAPTPDMSCRFRAADGSEHATNASFTSSGFVRCHAPIGKGNLTGAGAIGEHVQVRVSHTTLDDETGASPNWLPLLYIDTAQPPVVSSLSPLFGPVHEPTRVTLRGWNLGPVGPDLRCRFGDAPFTRGGWRGNQSVECVAPPASYQLVLLEGEGTIESIDAKRGAGTVTARLSIAGTPLSSDADNHAADFVYYIPEQPPTITEIVTPSWAGGDGTSGLSSMFGGEVVRILGANIAPTGSSRASSRRAWLSPLRVAVWQAWWWRRRSSLLLSSGAPRPLRRT